MKLLGALLQFTLLLDAILLFVVLIHYIFVDNLLTEKEENSCEITQTIDTKNITQAFRQDCE